MSINLFGVDDDKKVIYPLHVSSTFAADRQVDLLLYECNIVQHYVTIMNFSRSVGNQLCDHQYANFSCRRCLHTYTTLS